MVSVSLTFGEHCHRHSTEAQRQTCAGKSVSLLTRTCLGTACLGCGLDSALEMHAGELDSQYKSNSEDCCGGFQEERCYVCQGSEMNV